MSDSTSSRQKTGSCLCGGVRYTVRGPLRPVILCHCRQCRKTSGHYVAATQAALADVDITEETLLWFASSDQARRGFCGRCGGNLFWHLTGSDRLSILAGTLDLPTGLHVESQIFVDEKSDYYDLPACPIAHPA